MDITPCQGVWFANLGGLATNIEIALIATGKEKYLSKKKIKRRLKDLQESVTALHGRMASVQSYLEKICKHLGIHYGTTVNLTSFANIIKKLYPANIPEKLAGSPWQNEPVPARTEIDRESRIARAEEIAAKMLSEVEHDERDIISPPVNRNLSELEQKYRLPTDTEFNF